MGMGAQGFLQTENFYVDEISPAPTHFSIAQSEKLGSNLFEKDTDCQMKLNSLCCNSNQIRALT